MNRPDQSDAQSSNTQRDALTRIFAERNLTVTEAARLARVHPNSLFNFLHGRSNALSSATYSKLARALPGITVEELLGMASAPQMQMAFPIVQIRTEARAGHWRTNFELPLADQEELLLPSRERLRTAGAFGVTVREPGAEDLHRAGTILVVVPFAQYDGSLPGGSQVIIQRIRAEKMEITLREVEMIGQERWLATRSRHPRYREGIRLPWPQAGRAWQEEDGDRYLLVGVVASFYTPMELNNPNAKNPPETNVSGG